MLVEGCPYNLGTAEYYPQPIVTMAAGKDFTLASIFDGTS